MKKTFFKSVLCASLFVGALTSCNEVEDLYNPELVREKAKQALGLDIAADQDWNMTSVVTANFTLNEDALSDYSFRIYTANPLDKNSGATILADYPVKTDAQGKASASFKFEMPSYLNYVYVARIDDHGRRIVGVADIKNGAISKVFGGSTSTSTKAITDYELPTMSSPYTEDEVNSLIAASTNINDIEQYNNEVRIIGNVIVTGQVSDRTEKGEISYNAFYYYGASNPALGSNKLIITDGATLEIGYEQCSGMDIIVANGGTLKINQCLLIQDNARIIVMNGGKVINEYDATSQDDQNNINLNFSNGNNTMIYNEGTINIGVINVSNGATVYNAPNGQINAKTLNLSGGLDREDLVNWGKIEADRIVGNWGNGQQGAMHNGCLIRTNEINVLALNLKNNAAIETTNFTANQIYLRENSIVRSENFSSNSPNLFQYVGVEGGKALISTQHVKYLNINTWEGAPRQIYDNIYFETNTYEEEWLKQCLKIAMSKTNIGGVCAVGEAPLVILSETTNDIADAECIGNGNKPNDYVEEELPVQTYTYAFEDLNKEVGDYDMNDVVLKCTGPIDGNITIKLAAVGAQKNLFVYFKNKLNGQQIALFDGKEAHAALGVAEGTITNTGMGDAVSTVEQTINVGSDFLFTDHGDIYIVDEQGRESHIPNFDSTFTPGLPPYGICVPCDWKYPQEYVSVIKAYPSFEDWAGDVNEQDWYTKADESKVF